MRDCCLLSLVSVVSSTKLIVCSVQARCSLWTVQGGPEGRHQPWKGWQVFAEVVDGFN